MKFVSLFLVCIVLFNSSINCDEGECRNLNQKNEENHSNHKEDCPPFGVCNCCGVVVTFKTEDNYKQVDFYFQYISHIFNINRYPLKDYITSVWNPPKFA